MGRLRITEDKRGNNRKQAHTTTAMTAVVDTVKPKNKVTCAGNTLESHDRADVPSTPQSVSKLEEQLPE